MPSERDRNCADWRRVERALLDRITLGRLAPGERLDAQEAIAAEFGVTRYAVRQALDALGRAGLVAGIQGKGVYVCIPRLNYHAGQRLRFVDDLGLEQAEYRVELLRCGRRVASTRISEMLGLRRRNDAVVAEMLRWIGKTPVAISRAFLDIRRYPQALDRLREAGNLPDAYRLLRIPDHRHVETTFASRLPSAHEAALLKIGRTQPVLVTMSLNEGSPGTPVDVIEVAWRGDIVEVTR